MAGSCVAPRAAKNGAVLWIATPYGHSHVRLENGPHLWWKNSADVYALQDRLWGQTFRE